MSLLRATSSIKLLVISLSSLLMVLPSFAVDVGNLNDTHDFYFSGLEGTSPDELVDILINGKPEEFDIPYDISVRYPTIYDSYLLTTNADGLYYFQNLGEGYVPGGLSLTPMDLESEVQISEFTNDSETDVKLRVSGFEVIAESNDSGDNLVVTEQNSIPFDVAAVKSTLGVESSAVDATSVGVTSGVFSVGNGGSANYNLPIKLPPGLNGHTPVMGVGYSNGGGNGQLGRGWYLSGFPVISRCSGSPLYGEATFEGVTLSPKDRLCFNGQRLVQSNANTHTYWQVGAEYKTELDSRSVFTRLENNRFSIVSPTGSSSLYEKENTESWVLTSITDLFGTEIVYEYQEDNQYSISPLPSKVRYNHTLVEFEFLRGRYDVATRSVGEEMRMEERYLKRITISHKENLTDDDDEALSIRDYEFHYRYSGANSELLMKQIQECGFDITGTQKTCLLPVEVGYLAEGEDFASEASKLDFTAMENSVFDAISTTNIEAIMPMDWDLDGVNDIVLIEDVDGVGRARWFNGLGGEPEVLLPLSANALPESVTAYSIGPSQRGVVYQTRDAVTQSENFASSPFPDPIEYDGDVINSGIPCVHYGEAYLIENECVNYDNGGSLCTTAAPIEDREVVSTFHEIDPSYITKKYRDRDTRDPRFSVDIRYEGDVVETIWPYNHSCNHSPNNESTWDFKLYYPSVTINPPTGTPDSLYVGQEFTHRYAWHARKIPHVGATTTKTVASEYCGLISNVGREYPAEDINRRIDNFTQQVQTAAVINDIDGDGDVEVLVPIRDGDLDSCGQSRLPEIEWKDIITDNDTPDELDENGLTSEAYVKGVDEFENAIPIYKGPGGPVFVQAEENVYSYLAKMSDGLLDAIVESAPNSGVADDSPTLQAAIEGLVDCTVSSRSGGDFLGSRYGDYTVVLSSDPRDPVTDLPPGVDYTHVEYIKIPVGESAPEVINCKAEVIEEVVVELGDAGLNLTGVTNRTFTDRKQSNTANLPTNRSVFFDINADGITDQITFGVRTVNKNQRLEPNNVFIHYGNTSGFSQAFTINYAESSIEPGVGLSEVLQLDVPPGGQFSDIVRPFDYDGNNLTDLLIINGDANRSAYDHKFIVMKGVVSDDGLPRFEFVDTGITYDPAVIGHDFAKKIILMDADNDGNTDLMVSNGTGFDTYSQDRRYMNMAKSFGVSYDLEDQNDYDELCRSDVENKRCIYVEYATTNLDSDVYTFTPNNMDQEAGLYEINSALTVVKSVNKPVSATARDTINYHYAHAKVDSLERGFLGFESFTTESALFNRRTTTYFQGAPVNGQPRSFPEYPFIGAEIATKNVNTSNNTVSSTTQTLYESGSLQAGTHIVYPKKMFSVFYDKEGQHKLAKLAEFNIDANGHPDSSTLYAGRTTHTIAFDDDPDCSLTTGASSSPCDLISELKTTTVDAQYANQAVGFLESETTTISIPAVQIDNPYDVDMTGYHTETRVTQNTAHEDFPNVIGTTVSGLSAGALNAVEMTYGYSDALATYGQLLSMQVNDNGADTSGDPALLASAISQRQQVLSQYEFGVVPTRTGAVLNSDLTIESNQEFDHRFFAPISSEDPNGLTVTAEYDEFGRPLRQVTPAGAEIVYAYEYCSASLANCTASYAANAVTKNSSTSSDGSSSAQYVDLYGRVIATERNGFEENETIVSVTQFDARGRAERSYLPIKCDGSCPALGAFTQYQYYDDQNRSTTILADGSIQTVSSQVVEGNTQITTETQALHTHPQTQTESIRSLQTVKVLDPLGQTRRVLQQDPADTSIVIETRFEYDALGRMIRSEVLNGQTTDADENEVSQASAVSLIVYDDERNQQHLYEPNTGHSVTQFNVLGELVESTQYGQNNDGNFRRFTNTYDALGRITARYNFDATESSQTHYWHYETDSQGEPCGTGRLCEMGNVSPGQDISNADATTELFRERYSYVPGGEGSSVNGPGQIQGITTELRREGVTGIRSYQFGFTYDDLGRPETLTYPFGLSVANRYQNGYLQCMQELHDGAAPSSCDNPNPSDATNIWASSGYNAFGQTESYRFGNGAVVDQGYDVFGRLASINAGVGLSFMGQIKQATYGYDSLSNLTHRQTNVFGSNPGNGANELQYESFETFEYDPFNRLLSATRQTEDKFATVDPISTESTQYEYDQFGNILSKGDLQDYNYLSYSNPDVCEGMQSNAGPHAVKQADGKDFCYDEYGNLVNDGDNERSVTYNAMHKPISISQGSTQINFSYGLGGMRYYQEIVRSGSTDSQTYYIAGGMFEENIDSTGTTSYKSYIGDFMLHKRTGDEEERFYLLRDNLGSVDTVMDDNVLDDLSTVAQINNAIEEQLAYAPFGSRVLDSRPQSTTTPQINDRGFTDHEHLDEVSLIHMNGRVYDQTLGRFMSADPFVQSPFNSQSYNRYSYVWNNPLSMLDPSGYTAINVGNIPFHACNGATNLKGGDLCISESGPKGPFYILRLGDPENGDRHSLPVDTNISELLTAMADDSGHVDMRDVMEHVVAGQQRMVGGIDSPNGNARGQNGDTAAVDVSGTSCANGQCISFGSGQNNGSRTPRSNRVQVGVASVTKSTTLLPLNPTSTQQILASRTTDPTVQDGSNVVQDGNGNFAIQVKEMGSRVVVGLDNSSQSGGHIYDGVNMQGFDLSTQNIVQGTKSMVNSVINYLDESVTITTSGTAGFFVGGRAQLIFDPSDFKENSKVLLGGGFVFGLSASATLDFTLARTGSMHIGQTISKTSLCAGLGPGFCLTGIGSETGTQFVLSIGAVLGVSGSSFGAKEGKLFNPQMRRDVNRRGK